eukprot:TRINITY_DN7925_c0_g1_i1.p1 TRINITY_DN7925_c0_g1~~TRINITY_DN7925_c0_g1_i1.p1  ORF type:complete len:222 (+),score=36.78 TRINITY_DN7925_c0_g1_i1:22-666(+)
MEIQAANDITKSVISYCDVPSSSLKKFDAKGTYLPFPGLTVVSQLETDLEPWYRELDRIYPKHAEALLPYSSLHVTLRGLFVQKGFPNLGAYNVHLRKLCPQLLNLKKKLEDAGTNFEMNITGKQLSTLHLSASEETAKIITRWEGLIDSEFKQKDPRPQRHHLSLSYTYNRNVEISKREEELVMKVHQTLPKSLSFKPPRLCKFEDMTSFTPL